MQRQMLRFATCQTRKDVAAQAQLMNHFSFWDYVRNECGPIFSCNIMEPVAGRGDGRRVKGWWLGGWGREVAGSLFFLSGLLVFSDSLMNTETLLFLISCMMDSLPVVRISSYLQITVTSSSHWHRVTSGRLNKNNNQWKF